MNDSNYESDRKKSLIIRILIYVIIIGIICFFGFKLIVGDTSNEADEVPKIFDIVIYLCVLAVPILIIIANLKKKSYLNKLKGTKPELRFTYLDTFYYTKAVDNGDTLVNKFYSYHVIKENKSNKIYVVPGNPYYTNAMFQYIRGNASIVTGKGIRFINSSSWNEVNFNSQGSLWIEEEVNDYLTFDGNMYIFNNMEAKHKVKEKELSNCNPQYDSSLLKKATFITGYAEFDMNR